MSDSSRTAGADLDGESDDDWIEPHRIQDVSTRAVRPGASGSGITIISASSGSPRDRPKKSKVQNRPITRDQLRSDSSSDGHYIWDTHSSYGSTSESELSKISSQPLRHSMPVESGSVVEDTGISLGASYHDQGTCKPCLVIFSKLGCRNGSECQFCHDRSHSHNVDSNRQAPPGPGNDSASSINFPWQRPAPSKNRPGKGKRDRYKKMIAREVEIAEQAGYTSYSSQVPLPQLDGTPEPQGASGNRSQDSLQQDGRFSL